MGNFIKELQQRLKDKAIGSKREFLKEIIREVRVRGKEITLSYRLPLALPNSRKKGEVLYTVRNGGRRGT